MPYNGSGVYNKPSNSFSPAVGGTTIASAAWNTTHTDLATALSNVICKDGQTTVTANLPMATFRHTGVGDAQALTDYVSANQVVDGALIYAGASSAGTDSYAGSLPISPGTLVTGAKYVFKADVANTGACSFNLNSLGAKSIKLQDGSDPHNNAIVANQFVELLYDGTNCILMNPQDGQTMLDKVYPVGAIYMSTQNTSPQSLFGGTWTAIQTGRMLISEDGGTTYSAGDTGGSKDAIVVSHTHGVTDPGHSHTANTGGTAGTHNNRFHKTDNVAGTLSTNSSTTGISINSTGSSGTNANMPPYLAVYMWERTA